MMITALLVCFNTVLTFVILRSVMVLSYPSTGRLGVPPDNVWQEIFDIFIEKYNFTVIQWKHPRGNNVPPRKRRIVNYDVIMPLMQWWATGWPPCHNLMTNSLNEHSIWKEGWWWITSVLIRQRGIHFWLSPKTQ